MESYKELAKEHRRLVKVLKSPSHKDDRREAALQSKELRKYEKQSESIADELIDAMLVETSGSCPTCGKPKTDSPRAIPKPWYAPCDDCEQDQADKAIAKSRSNWSYKRRQAWKN